MKVFNTTDDIRKLMLTDKLRLVIITKNGKRILNTIWWTFKNNELTISSLEFTNDDEWQELYKLTYDKYLDLIDNKQIIGYYYKN